MSKEQSPLHSGIIQIHCALLLTVLAVMMFVNPSFVFATNGNFLVNFSVAVVFIAILTAVFVNGYNKIMLGRSQIWTLGKAKFVIVILNVSVFLLIGALFVLPCIHLFDGKIDSDLMLFGILSIIELISIQYYKKIFSNKPELIK
jgi:hypothetical protein